MDQRAAHGAARARQGTLLGGITFRNVLVKYDRARQRVGFGEAPCQRLGRDLAPPCDELGKILPPPVRHAAAVSYGMSPLKVAKCILHLATAQRSSAQRSSFCSVLQPVALGQCSFPLRSFCAALCRHRCWSGTAALPSLGHSALLLSDHLSVARMSRPCLPLRLRCTPRPPCPPFTRTRSSTRSAPWTGA